MELAFLILVVVLALVALLEAARSSDLQRQNNDLQRQREMWREIAMDRDNGGGMGCGSILGLLVLGVAIAAILLQMGGFLS